MRIIEKLREFRANQRIWKAYKQQIIATYARAGFSQINYQNQPVTRDTTPQTQIHTEYDPTLEQSVRELVQEMNQPAIYQPPKTPVLMQAPNAAARMNIINRKAGQLT